MVASIPALPPRALYKYEILKKGFRALPLLAQIEVVKAPRVQLANELDSITERPTSRRQPEYSPKPERLRNPFHPTRSAEDRCQTRDDDSINLQLAPGS